MTLLQSGLAKSLVSDYTIDQSLRFDGSQYLSRTPGVAGNRKTWTISFWTKLCGLSNPQKFMCAGSGGSDETYIDIDGNQLTCKFLAAPFFEGTIKLRDVASWYHFVIALDTNQSLAINRLKVYKNGEDVTSLGNGVIPAEDLEPNINQDTLHDIGRLIRNDGHKLESYLAEYYLIDGTQYAASDFGETDEDTNQWKPKNASGLTFGTNGFYLKFEDSADLGNDSSGEDNDFSVTNLVATDQVKDSPTNNFSTLNSIFIASANSATSEGNLQVDASAWGLVGSTIGMSSGKWYAEYIITADGNANGGLWDITSWNASTTYYSGNPNYRWDSGGGVLYNESGAVATYSDYADGDVLGLAYNADSGAFYIAKNNTWQNSGDPAGGTGSVASSLTGTWMFGFDTNTDTNLIVNFGQDSSFAGVKTAGGNADSNGVGDFFYAPPTDYLALCTSNLSDPSIIKSGTAFNTVLYSGNSADDHNITGVGFKPGFVWIKDRNVGPSAHYLVDSVRGLGTGDSMRVLASNSSDPEYSNMDDQLVSFDTDGFTVDDNTDVNFYVNITGENYASWNWLAGGTPTATNTATTGVMTSGSVFQNGVSNTSFTPGSTIYPEKISANTTNGFSIVEYDGNLTSGATVAHGLSQAPELYVVKSTGIVNSWMMYADPLGSNNRYVQLNEAGAYESNTNRWNDTSPTPSLFSLGNSTSVNTSAAPYIVYCFHSVEGYSKVGRYEGNGESAANAPFVYCGFRPAWVMIKGIDAGSRNWMMYDNKRSPYNAVDDYLEANDNAVEATGSSEPLDFLSNGFRIRSDQAQINPNETCLFLAFAESPFKYANAR